MKKNISLLFSLFKKERCDYKLSYLSMISILIFPLFIVFLFSLLLFMPSTQDFTLIQLKENNSIEMLTFIFLLVASIIGLKLASDSYLKKTKTYVWIFITLFSILLFIVAMEEISWGQQLFKFKTPEAIAPLNAQGELTLHNINSLQGKSEYFRLFFGFFGLLGILLGKYDFFKPIAPSKILVVFFFTITIVSSIDLYADYNMINENYDKGLQRLSELIEMLIGVSALLYIIFLNKRLNS